MDIIKELESLNFDASIYAEKTIKECSHREKACIVGTLKLKEKQTKNGLPYYILTIVDKTGLVSCPAWNNTALYKFLEPSDNGKLVRVYGEISIDDYTNIEIKQIQFVKEPEEEKEEVVSISNLKVALNERVARITNDYMRNIATKAIEFVGDKLDVAPFTEKTSYNYEGGLMQEIIDACDVATAMTDTFNCGYNKNSTMLNEDMLLTGVILCNLGKTRTLTIENGIPVKTFDGSLDEDAIFSREIAFKVITDVMESIPLEEKDSYDKVFKELLHMVASAKGNKAYGALSTPRSKHALILSDINNIVYTKGLFERLEDSSNEEFTKAYDNGKNYFLGACETE